MTRIGDARGALGAYNALIAAIPNASLLLAPLTTREAVLSSKIEGTHVTMGEVLEVEADADTSRLTRSKRDDIEEVANYRRALTAASKSLEARNLSQHLLRATHAILMEGVRGQRKEPGAYRTEQNWIGPDGCAIDDASFVPVAPEHLAAGMDAWERHLLDLRQPEPLVQLAIAHAEFEALHPFEDGNGRLGRMLIPLFLYARDLLSSPDFYMSGYFERNREVYIERLRAVSRDGAWTEWCAYFLEGVIEQARENEARARAILDLYERYKKEFVDLTRSQYAIRAVDFVFQSPIFKATTLRDDSRIPAPTANRILNVLREAGIVQTLRSGRGRRAGVFLVPEILAVAEGGPEVRNGTGS
ncbi:MAG: Fic/DOC family N-terminal domain-containing protein [Trueperaceae bacterium]